MDSANSTSGPNPPHQLPRARVTRWVLVAIAAILYGILLGTHVGAWAGGADSSGYLNNARLLRAGRFQIEQRTIEGLPSSQVSSFTYVPLGFIPKNRDQMVPTYPVGLSLLIVAVSPFTGWAAAPHVTEWLHGLAGVALIFALARAMGLGLTAGFWSALIMAASPLYVMMSLQAMSDLPALVWCTAAMLCAWLSRQRDRWAFAAGWCVAIAVLVRPSNLLIMGPVALCLGLGWRRWLWLALGGIPGAAFLGWLNFDLYGSPFNSGYGPVGGIFRWEHVPPALSNYVRWLPVILTPGIVLFFAFPWLYRRESRWLITVLATWAATFPLFYVSYLHTHEDWWYLRFLMPSFPAIILLMVLVARMILSRRPTPWPRFASWGLAAVIVAWASFWGGRLHVLSAGRGERIYRDTAVWTRAHLPANAVLAAMQTSGALFYYTDHTVIRYDQFNPAKFSVIETACAALKRPIYAVLYPFELEEVLEKRLPGRWTQVGAVNYATIWRRDGSEPADKPPVPWTPLAAARVGESEVSVNGVAGWFSAESDHKNDWAWSSAKSEVEVKGTRRENLSVQLNFALRSLAPCTVTVKQNGAVLWKGPVGIKRSFLSLPIPLVDGQARLEFSSDSPGVRETSEPDSRLLAFAVYDARLAAAKSPP
ncbi:MAG TPA: phospholipid carrier-dependent glycosyltransferase [Opitutaceae bacterium]|nr:phospholipid carrier-dependent glycosyltransferase [Opitutaceae bacterium]